MKRILILFLMCICIDIQAQDVIKHVVKRGETLSSIAKTYGTTEDRIKRLNKNVSNFLYAGMELTIEQGYSKASPQESDINIRNFMTISEQEDQIKKLMKMIKLTMDCRCLWRLVLAFWSMEQHTIVHTHLKRLLV